VLNSQPVKPHGVRYYLQRRAPALEERKAEVLEVYAAAEMLRQMPEADRPVAVLSDDEKPGIQAIATTAPDLPPKSGKHATVQRDHAYRRLRTATPSVANAAPVLPRWRYGITPQPRHWRHDASRQFANVVLGPAVI
jgi:hypothetical protein